MRLFTGFLFLMVMMSSPGFAQEADVPSDRTSSEASRATEPVSFDKNPADLKAQIEEILNDGEHVTEQASEGPHGAAAK